MCSWGSNTKLEKFYKGAQNDTPWNKDLLWRYHVAKEDKQVKVNTGELPSPDLDVKLRRPRLKMGITGSLIPDFTPRYEEPVLVPSNSQQRIDLDERLADFRSARSRTSTGSRPLKSSRSSSSLSSSSSLRSVRLQDVQELLESQSRLLKEKTDVEIAAMRHALQDEARKRQDAERKIHFLCEKLGIEDTS